MLRIRPFGLCFDYYNDYISRIYFIIKLLTICILLVLGSPGDCINKNATTKRVGHIGVKPQPLYNKGLYSQTYSLIIINWLKRKPRR